MKKIVLLLVLILCASSVAFASESQQSRGKHKKATTHVTKKSQSKVTAATPAWLNGNWKYTTYMMGMRFECRVGISGSTIVVMSNGDMMYSGSFVIEGNQLIYNRRNGSYDYLIIDRAYKRIMADRSTPFYRY